jgi:hypothetical protein
MEQVSIAGDLLSCIRDDRQAFDFLFQDTLITPMEPCVLYLFSALLKSFCFFPLSFNDMNFAHAIGTQCWAAMF